MLTKKRQLLFTWILMKHEFSAQNFCTDALCTAKDTAWLTVVCQLSKYVETFPPTQASPTAESTCTTTGALSTPSTPRTGRSTPDTPITWRRSSSPRETNLSSRYVIGRVTSVLNYECLNIRSTQKSLTSVWLICVFVKLRGYGRLLKNENPFFKCFLRTWKTYSPCYYTRLHDGMFIRSTGVCMGILPFASFSFS